VPWERHWTPHGCSFWCACANAALALLLLLLLLLLLRCVATKTSRHAMLQLLRVLLLPMWLQVWSAAVLRIKQGEFTVHGLVTQHC
jgi:hypothetical protein